MTRRELLGLGAGAAAAGVAAVLATREFLRAWLLAWTFFTGLSVGCLALLLLHHLVGGRWGRLVRRVLEAGAAALPWLAVGLVPVLLGAGRIYPWLEAPAEAAAGDSPLAGKAVWLNLPFFVARSLLYFACWIHVASRLLRLSVEEDRTLDPDVGRRMRRVAGPSLCAVGLTATFAAIDWLMTIDPEWYSVAYGTLVLTADTLSALLLAILALGFLARREDVARHVGTQQVHDLGNLLLAFVMLWAYVSFSQFLVIWSGNLPEDRGWVHDRVRGGFGVVAAAILVLHFAVPFVVLLFRDVKQRISRLAALAAGLAVLRMLDRYWFVAPSFEAEGALLPLLAVLLLVVVGFAWGLVVRARLSAHPLLPLAPLGETVDE